MVSRTSLQQVITMNVKLESYHLEYTQLVHSIYIYIYKYKDRRMSLSELFVWSLVFISIVRILSRTSVLIVL